MNEDYMKKRVTIYQVATESGFSLATVSRVINDKGNVTEETKRKVLETIERLGYKPSAIAQGLAKSNTTSVGIVIPSSMYSYVANMLSGMTDIAKIYGYKTILFVTSQDKQASSKVVEEVIQANVEGVVIFDDQLSEDDIKKMVSYSVPVCVIGRDSLSISDNVAIIPLKYEQTLRKTIDLHFEKGDENVYFLKMDEGEGSLMTSLLKIAEDECIKLGHGDKFFVKEISDSYTKTYDQFYKLFKYINSMEYVYFVHSYYGKYCEESIIADSEYEINIPAVVKNDNVYGIQFHPEKSGSTGLNILKGFKELI